MSATDAVPGEPLPELMTAAVYPSPGVITVEDRPVPRPGRGQVLVRVHHCGVCGSDIRDELQGIRDRAEAFRKKDDRLDLIDLHADDQGVVKIHSLYVHYILPMICEFQHWEFAS